MRRRRGCCSILLSPPLANDRATYSVFFRTLHSLSSLLFAHGNSNDLAVLSKCCLVLNSIGLYGSGPQGSGHSNRTQGEPDARRRRSIDESGGGAGRVGGGGDLLDEELHVYIAAMQLFPIKLNFSFIKNADVKVQWILYYYCQGCARFNRRGNSVMRT